MLRVVLPACLIVLSAGASAQGVRVTPRPPEVSAEASVKAAGAALEGLRRLRGGTEALEADYGDARFQQGLIAGAAERGGVPEALSGILAGKGAYELTLTASEQLGDWFDEKAAWDRYQQGKAAGRRPGGLRAGLDPYALEFGQMIASVMIVAHDEAYEWSDAELAEMEADVRTSAEDLAGAARP